MSRSLASGSRKRIVYLTRPRSGACVLNWEGEGFTEALLHPRIQRLIFVTPDKAREILQRSGERAWDASARAGFPIGHSTNRISPPTNAPIRVASASQKTLQDIAHAGDNAGTLENNLMFSGHNAFRFAKDPFYSNGFIPTVKQLVERILTGR